MSIARLLRWAGLVSIVAAVLLIGSDIVGVTLDRANPGTVLASPAFAAFTILKLAGAILLLVSLVGLYVRQSVAAGRLGLVGALVAFIGTALVAGDWWFEAFVVPWLLDRAPSLATAAGSGSLLLGAGVSFALFSIGWMLFGLATYRARVFPRWSAVVLTVGGALAYFVGIPPFGLVLAASVGILGVLALRLDTLAAPAAPAVPVLVAGPVVDGSAPV